MNPQYTSTDDNLKTASTSPVSTEWIVLVWFLNYMVTIERSLRTGNQIDS